MKRVQCLICKIHLTYTDTDDLLEHLNSSHYGMDFLTHVSSAREEFHKTLYKGLSLEDVQSLFSDSDCQCSDEEVCVCPPDDELSITSKTLNTPTSASVLDGAAANDQARPQIQTLSIKFKSCDCSKNEEHKKQMKERLASEDIKKKRKECACPEDIKKKDDTTLKRKDIVPGKKERKEDDKTKAKDNQAPTQSISENNVFDSENSEKKDGQSHPTTSSVLLHSVKIEPSSSDEINKELTTNVPKDDPSIDRHRRGLNSPEREGKGLQESENVKELGKRSKDCNCCAKKGKKKAGTKKL